MTDAKDSHLMERPGDKTTHFGFGQVPKDAKTGLVKDLFASVADRYDVMNDAMSLGAHRLWKSAVVDWLAPRPGQAILDLAGGTGDIAIRILRREPEAAVSVLDLTEKMLEAGRRRADAAGLGGKVNWITGDAMALPFADKSFDSCATAFGIRNFTDIRTGLAEMFRVLKIGGRLLVLEFSEVGNPGLRSVYDRYSFDVIPALGEAIAKDRESYRYLVESIRRFPGQQEFSGMVEDAGFDKVSCRSLSFGIAAIHSGWRL